MTSYGVPLDTRHTYTKSDWSIWTAAIVTDTTVRDSFITGVVNYCKDGESSQPLGDWYDTNGGGVEGFRARPVVGGHLALVRIFLPPLYSFKDLRRRCSFCYKQTKFAFGNLSNNFYGCVLNVINFT